ncbi:MAG: bifunctional folylpolyglutamate synthase/dihydrofolate synthase [Rikenellaceae bacterium]|nr:bifunctional folylpolyglutamate synthase/dihydrofolate synthase [Rikenellaceae bacterium]
MTTEEALDRLLSIPMFQQVGGAAYNPGTERMEAFCRFLGDPQKMFRSVHVAGTNGKGSVSHMTAALLAECGLKTGLYTSPHIRRAGERVRIDGTAMSDGQIADFMERAMPFIDEHGPSFFEVTTAMAFDRFARDGVDVAVIETGLGGRLDATNVITPSLSVITNVSLDHTAILGDTVMAIAVEKAGIIKPDTPVVIGQTDPESAVVFIDKAHECRSPVTFADKMYRVVDYECGTDGSAIFHVESLLDGYRFSLGCDLGGACQRHNIPTFLAVAERLADKGLEVGRPQIEKALAHVAKSTGLLGRWQVLARNPLTVCDTGHNEAGIREVVSQIERLRAQRAFDRLFMVFGVVADKDLARILPLLPREAGYIFTRPSVARGLDAEELARRAAEAGLQGTVMPDVHAALEEAKRISSPEDMIFVGGSSYLVGDLLQG